MLPGLKILALIANILNVDIRLQFKPTETNE